MRRLEAPSGEMDDHDDSSARGGACSIELRRSLAEIKGQAQFLLYLADQIEESLEQLVNEADPCHGAFLCKVLGHVFRPARKQTSRAGRENCRSLPGSLRHGTRTRDVLIH